MSPRTLRFWRAAAVVFVLGVVAAHFDPATGFTSLIRFGEVFAPRRLPELSNLPLPTVSGAGYDGQFYAQLAVEPDITSPQLHNAVDVPAYRARRILLPLVAHVLGLGNPWWTLQVYALLNTTLWLVLAWYWWRISPDRDLRGTMAWLVSVLSLGALDSVRFSLTDLPMTVCLVFAVSALARGRSYLPGLMFLAAGFVRETAVLAVQPSANNGTPRERLGGWLRAAFCVAPPVLWCVSLLWLAPGTTTGITGNFDWPGVAFVRHLFICSRELAGGNFDSRHLFGLIGALSMAYQAVYLLQRWRDNDRWLRLGLPFAVLFWFLGDYLWQGYWAAARTLLPMTFVFNRSLLADRRWKTHLVAGNFYVLHSLYRFLPF